eukprot:Gb_13971 [translate_table: standard]
MWDSFTSGILLSSIRNGYANIDGNEFALLTYRNITIITSNKPYGIHDGSNPLFDNRTVPRFHLKQGGVHSGHVQTGIRDPFCLVSNGKGKCMASSSFPSPLLQHHLKKERITLYVVKTHTGLISFETALYRDGYSREVSGTDGARVLIAEKAKPNKDINSTLDREYFISFLRSEASLQEVGLALPMYHDSLQNSLCQISDPYWYTNASVIFYEMSQQSICVSPSLAPYPFFTVSKSGMAFIYAKPISLRMQEVQSNFLKHAIASLALPSID